MTVLSICIVANLLVLQCFLYQAGVVGFGLEAIVISSETFSSSTIGVWSVAHNRWGL
jgi:hypothetical protein